MFSSQLCLFGDLAAQRCLLRQRQIMTTVSFKTARCQGKHEEPLSDMAIVIRFLPFRWSYISAQTVSLGKMYFISLLYQCRIHCNVRLAHVQYGRIVIRRPGQNCSGSHVVNQVKNGARNIGIEQAA